MSQSSSQSPVTYCMGYWQVPQNAKRSLGHYLTLIPRTIEMLAGQRLILFTDSMDIRQLVQTCCSARHVQFLYTATPLGNLPAAECAGKILHKTGLYGQNTSRPMAFHNEKGLHHYWRDFLGSGPAAYQRILSIWLSKVLLVNAAVQSDPFATSHFAWIDATVSRFNAARPNWSFVTLPNRRRVISHYSSPMRKFGNPLSLNASFLKGDKEAWSELSELYLTELASAAEERYPNDEETILHNVREKRPALFETLDLIPDCRRSMS